MRPRRAVFMVRWMWWSNSRTNWYYDGHYDAIVHREQVAGERLGEAECAAERAATRRYKELLSDSVFSLCPEGAGPNTLRLWESLAVGAIPVVIVEDWVWPSIPGAGLRWEDAQKDELVKRHGFATFERHE